MAHKFISSSQFDRSVLNWVNVGGIALFLAIGLISHSGYWIGLSVFETLYVLSLSMIKKRWIRELTIDDNGLVYASRFPPLFDRVKSIGWGDVKTVEIIPYVSWTWPDLRVLVGREPEVKMLRITLRDQREAFQDSISIFKEEGDIIEILKNTCLERGIPYTLSWKKVR